MKKATKKTQCQQLLAYLKKNRKQGITTMEAFRELGITCVHKRISELQEALWREWDNSTRDGVSPHITRTKERTATGSTVTRYKLPR